MYNSEQSKLPQTAYSIRVCACVCSQSEKTKRSKNEANRQNAEIRVLAKVLSAWKKGNCVRNVEFYLRLAHSIHLGATNTQLKRAHTYINLFLEFIFPVLACFCQIFFFFLLCVLLYTYAFSFTSFLCDAKPFFLFFCWISVRISFIQFFFNICIAIHCALFASFSDFFFWNLLAWSAANESKRCSLAVLLVVLNIAFFSFLTVHQLSY